jgi:hypothetical protein
MNAYLVQQTIKELAEQHGLRPGDAVTFNGHLDYISEMSGETDWRPIKNASGTFVGVEAEVEDTGDVESGPSVSVYTTMVVRMARDFNELVYCDPDDLVGHSQFESTVIESTAVEVE